MARETAAIRCSAAAAAMATIVLFLLIQPSISIYCDEDDCYDLLGVTQNANASEIKKAYYKLSLKYHPDKNSGLDSRKLFVKIANAYEILKDEATREQYDYAIAHPEEFFYNTAHYYQAYYGHKTDARAVLVGLLLILSAFQYMNQWTRYNQIWLRRHQLTRIDSVDLNLNAVEGQQRKRRVKSRWTSRWRKISAKNLTCKLSVLKNHHSINMEYVLALAIPIQTGSLLLEDASYLTQRSLGIPLDSWRQIDELRREDLVKKRLWVKSNLDSYLAEMRKESKRKR